MYSLLKPLLKVVGYVPPEKEERVKMRVIPHSRNYFVAQFYKNYTWHNFINPYMASVNYPDLWDINHPQLSDNFENLVEFCKKFKTFDEIEERQKKLRDNFNKLYKECLKKNQEFKEKSWQSE